MPSGQFVWHEHDRLSLCIFLQLFGEIFREHQVKLLANLGLEGMSQVCVTRQYLIECDYLVACEHFILELSHKKFGVKVCQSLLSIVDSEELAVHFAEMFEVNDQSQVEFPLQVHLSNGSLQPIPVDIVPARLVFKVIVWGNFEEVLAWEYLGHPRVKQLDLSRPNIIPII